MIELIRVGVLDITVGQPLPYSVFDKSGNLLLREGYVITLHRHRDHLIENGLYAQEKAVQSARSLPPVTQAAIYNAFESLDLVKEWMQRLFNHCKLGKIQENFTDQVYELAMIVQEACAYDTDSVLANLNLDYKTSYTIVHHLQAALLCELIGKKLAIKEDERLILVSAALTHDVGLLDIQDTLDQQSAPLTAEQRQRIEAHTMDSAELLQSVGVTDSTWLDAVRYHHERLDGSGYPAKLAGANIGTSSRILAVADIYSAMVRDRPYRKALVSKKVMRDMLMEQGDKVDHRLIQLMIKELGVFPPGAIVKLVNGEIGVVKQRQANTANPIVYAFVDGQGMPTVSPMMRDTTKPEYQVEGILPFSNYRNFIGVIRKLWI